jgi:hypothetical protein
LPVVVVAGSHRRLAAERSVRALGVVMVGVDAQDAVELTRAEDQQPVQALRATHLVIAHLANR